MKKILYLLILTMTAMPSLLAQEEERKKLKDEEGAKIVDVLYNPTITAGQFEDIYIPEDIADCCKQLDVILPDSTKTKIKKLSESDFIAYSHFGLGRWIDTAWGLHNDSRLAAYFNSLGIKQQNDMTSIILTSYYRTLKGKKVKFDEQIEDYANAYLLNKYPDAETYPQNIKNIGVNSVFGFYNKDNRKASLFVYVANEECWIYGYNYGWTEISEDNLKKIENTKMKSRRKLIEKIYKTK